MQSNRLPPVYDSAALTSPMIQEAREIFRYRDLLWLLTTSQIKTRYKRSVLGIAWTLLSPLLTMTVLTIAFSQLFRFRLPAYPVYVLSGLMLWSLFTQSTTTGMRNLTFGSSVLQRVYVPPSLFPLSAMGSGIVNLALAMVPLALIMLIFGHPFSPALLFVPVAILLTAMFSLGLTLFMSTLAAFFTDVVDMYDVAIRAWYFLTPILYPVEIFPEKYRWLLEMNPMYHNMLCWRMPIYEGRLPEPTSILVAGLWGIGMLALGWLVFSRKTHEFAYRA